MRSHPTSVPAETASASVAPPTVDIAALTRGMVKADDRAFALFQETYLNRLSRYLIVVTGGDEQRMRDSLQETFRRVARNIRVFEREEVFWSWLTTLARSACIDDHRATQRYRTAVERFGQDPAATSPSDDAASARLKELVGENLARFSPADRAILEAKYFDKVSVRDLALQLGATESAVESRLLRLRQKLKAAVLADLKHDSAT